MADLDDFDRPNSQNNDSGGSGDEDENDFTDADAAIDRMLDELQDFQFELDGVSTKTDEAPKKIEPKSPTSPKSPQIPNVTSSLDHLRFSTIAIEDSPDVDLDALLEELCCMERDIASAGNMSSNDSGISSNSSSTLSSMNSAYSDSSKFSSKTTARPMSPKSPVPANVTADVRDRLENLQEETRELTPEEQEARFKAEKIKIALEKMKAASVQRLVVKVFDENLETSKTMLMDQTWTAREVVTKMIKKNDVEIDPNWCLVEKLPELHMERIIEEDETVLPLIFDWTRDTTNMLVFLKRRDKYTLFRNPQNFLLATGTSAGAAQLAEKSKDILLEEFFTREHTRIPEVEGVLWLREGKRTWNKHFFVLRASGVYYTPKGKTKASRDLICLVKFEHASVYLGVGIKKKYRAPADNVFCLKHPKVQTSKSKHVYFLCAEDQKTLQHWVTAIRMAKYGYQMYDNYLLTQQNVEKELMLSSLANRGNASVKFQDEDDEFMEKNGTLKRRQSDTLAFRGSARPGLPQVSSSSTVRVKGQGTSRLGSLFSNAWKKGNEDASVNILSTTTAAEDALSPGAPVSTFSIDNRASSISSRASLKSISSKGSLKSRSSISEKPKSLCLDPPPAGKNGKPLSPSSPPAPPSPPAPSVPVAPPAPPAPSVPVAPPAPPAPSVPLAPPAPPAPSVPLAPPAPPAPSVPVAPPAPPAPSVPLAPPAPPPPPMVSGIPPPPPIRASPPAAPTLPTEELPISPTDFPPPPMASGIPPPPPIRASPPAAPTLPTEELPISPTDFPPPPMTSGIPPPPPMRASPPAAPTLPTEELPISPTDFPPPPPPLPPPRRSSMSIKSSKP